MKKKILVYVEPHPLRNTLTEFAGAGCGMCKMVERINLPDMQWKVYANNWVLPELERKNWRDHCIIPTEEETDYALSSLQEWGDETLQKRLDLVKGHGVDFEFYYALLTRIYATYRFTHLMIWSDNGAVRQFAADHEIVLIHFELGPTRAPFMPTLYLDPYGTNGANAIAKLGLDILEGREYVPVDSWLALSDIASKDVQMAKEVVQSALSSELLPLLSGKKYVVVALQLADDLNTALHSDFKNPKQFLEHIIPPLLKHGFHIVIKGHPFSHTRPYNLVAEGEAIQFARQFGDDVTIVDRRLSASEFIPICVRSQAVLSINSSVSFEAWLLGVPGLVFGKAAYDIADHIYNLGKKFLTRGTIAKNRGKEIISFLCSTYFHSYNEDYIVEILSHHIENAKFYGENDALDFIKFLQNGPSYTAFLLEKTKSQLSKKLSLPAAVKGRNPPPKQNVSAPWSLIEFKSGGDLRSFIGNVELFNLHKKGNITQVKVSGWLSPNAEDKRLDEIALFYRDALLTKKKPTPRPDVMRFYKHAGHCGFNFSVEVASNIDVRQIEIAAFCSGTTYKSLLDLGYVFGAKADQKSKVRRWLKKVSRKLRGK